VPAASQAPSPLTSPHSLFGSFPGTTLDPPLRSRFQARATTDPQPLASPRNLDSARSRRDVTGLDAWHTSQAHAVSSHPIPSHPISSHPISSHPISSHRIPSHRIPSHPIPSHPIPSHPISSHPISSHPIPSHLIASHPISSHPIPSHPISSHPIPSHRIPSHLIASHLAGSGRQLTSRGGAQGSPRWACTARSTSPRLRRRRS
jgi:hypothetical protein